MGNPTVSVIMAAYNHAGYIAQAITSVLSQSWQDLELIVIDDGSTDRTREVVAGFADPVRYIYQENQGQGGARNTGIAHARGEFISFLDDDDLWLPDCLETVMAVLRSRPEVGALYAACQVIDSEGHPFAPDHVAGRSDRGNVRHLGGGRLVPSSGGHRAQVGAG